MIHIKNNKFISIFALMVSFSATFLENSNSQSILEGGPFLGISWYNGDLNPQRLFYNNHPSLGVILRYSANDRIGFRGSLIMGGISGEYPTKNVILKETENFVPYEFKRNITDVAVCFDMNLFSFDHPYKKASHFTPYMSFGLGTIFYKRFQDNKEKPYFALSLPFGAGVKWKMKNGLRFGAEWSMRKTFADDLDLVGHDNSVDPSDPFGFDQWKTFHNNDWVSFVGVYVSVSIFNRREKCRGGDGY